MANFLLMNPTKSY